MHDRNANGGVAFLSAQSKHSSSSRGSISFIRTREPLSNGLPRFGYSAKDILVAMLALRTVIILGTLPRLTHHAPRYCLEIL